MLQLSNQVTSDVLEEQVSETVGHFNGDSNGSSVAVVQEKSIITKDEVDMLMSPDDEQMAMDENSFQTKNQLLVTEEELAVTEDQEQMSTDVVLPSTHDRVISASEGHLCIRGRVFSQRAHNHIC